MMLKSLSFQTIFGYCAKIFNYCVNKLWLLLASLIILLALIHVLLGFLLPQVNDYQKEVVDWIEAKYQLDVEVDRIDASWSTQGPLVTLTNLRIVSDDGQYDILNVGSVTLYFDIVSSIWNGRFSTQEILIDNANLKFYINRKLGVALDQETEINPPIDLEGASHRLIDAIFGQRKIVITDSSLKLLTLSGTEFFYHIDQLEVRKFNKIHQLNGQLSHKGGGQLELVTEIYGDPTLATSYSNIYIKASRINIADLPWQESFPITTPKEGVLSWQFWGRWKNRHWQQANATVELENLNWNDKDQKVQNKMSALFSWQHDDIEKGYLSIHHFRLEDDQNQLQELPEIFVKFNRGDNQQISWNLLMQDFPVKPVSRYLSGIVANDNSALSFLNNLKGHSSINKLSMTIHKISDQWVLPKLSMIFSFDSNEKNDASATSSGFTGVVRVDSLKGRALLQANSTQLDFGKMFRAPIALDKLNAYVSWSKDSHNNYEVKVSQLELQNQDLNLQGKARFFTQDNQPKMALYTELTNVDAGQKSKYLPVTLMTKDLVSYLDKAVKSGHFPIIKAAVRGPLDRFPYKNQEGVFFVLGKLRDSLYQYLPDWPAVEGMDADLLFVGNGMDIKALAGQSMSNRVNFARAVTRDFSVAKPKLELTLDINSQDNSAKRFLDKTPISFIAEAMEIIDFQGELTSKITMLVGLSDEDTSEAKVEGEVVLAPDKSKISLPFAEFKEIKGKVKFNQRGLVNSQLSASYRGEKLAVSIHEPKNKALPLVLKVKGLFPSSGIVDFLDTPWDRLFDGVTPFESETLFYPNGQVKEIIRSDLLGLSIGLPGKLGKTKTQRSPLYLEINSSQKNQSEMNVASIQWNDVVGRWFWSAEKTKPESGGNFYINHDISDLQRLNKTAETFKPGIRVEGRLDKTDLTQWIDLYNHLGFAESESSDKALIDRISLNIDYLKLPLTYIEQVSLSVKQTNHLEWEIGGLSKQGQFFLSLHSKKPWVVKLEDISLTLDENLFETDNQELSEKEFSQIDFTPFQLNEMDLICNQCIVQNRDLGEIKLKLRKRLKGVEFSTLVVKPKYHSLSLQGSWLMPAEGKSITELQFDLNTSDVGRLFDDWDIEAAIKDSRARLYADISWKSDPWDFHPQSLNGGMQLALGKGYLSEISDEKGRIFSLFNLNSLVRKLTFDFKDVYKKGFFFDSLKGSFSVDKGLIQTQNLRIKGNVADVKIYGGTDLADKTIEQYAVITPHLTSSLPVLAAWAVEPTTGIIVFLLNKIMQPAVEVATRIDYRIHGSFDEVQVDQLNTSKKKIPLEQDTEENSSNKAIPKEEEQKIKDEETSKPKG